MISAFGIEHTVSTTTVSKSDFPAAVAQGARNFRRNKPGKLKRMQTLGARHKAQGGSLHEEVNRPPRWKPGMRRAWDEGFNKAFKKVNPKLVRSGSFEARKTDSLQDRFKVDYRQWRHKSGALQNEMNPKKWDKNDAENLKHGLGPPHPRSIAARKKGEKRTREKARNLKLASQAVVTGHANAGKKQRYLP